MSQHPVFCTILKRISDEHRYPDEPFAALADFKRIRDKARKLTRHELLRKKPASRGAKLLIAVAAMRTYRNRHLGLLMHCCAACGPVGQYLTTISFECANFHGLSQIIASLTRENIGEWEAAMHDLPWTQTEKDSALAAKCKLSLRAWLSKKPTPCLHAVTEEEGRPLDVEDESGTRLCTCLGRIFE